MSNLYVRCATCPLCCTCHRAHATHPLFVASPLRVSFDSAVRAIAHTPPTLSTLCSLSLSACLLAVALHSSTLRHSPLAYSPSFCKNYGMQTVPLTVPCHIFSRQVPQLPAICQPHQHKGVVPRLTPCALSHL